MHRTDVMSEAKWSYRVETNEPEPYSENYTFCSYECLLAFLVDDEKVLKLKLKRINLHHSIRHPHEISRAVTVVNGASETDKIYILEGDQYTKQEALIPLNMEYMDRKDLEKELDKEELASLDALSAE